MPEEFILRLAWPGAVLLLLALAALSLFALWQHSSRHSRLRRVRDLQSKVEPLLTSLFSGSIEYAAALKRIGDLAAQSESDSIGELLTAEPNPPGERILILRSLCEDLGLVALWQRQLILEQPSASGRDSGHRQVHVGRRRHVFAFVLRAEAAENLGIIRHQPSWPLLVRALSDPHLTVRSVAARALASILEPESFPGLAEHLPSAALELAPEISAGTLKMALASFPVNEASRLKKFLEDPSWQVRSLAAGVIAAMLQQQDAGSGCESLPPCVPDAGVLDIFFGRLAFDQNPELRARASDVAGYVHDPRSLALLKQLVNDAEWFVRLRAVKALARHRPTSVVTIKGSLTDSHWRVREAAAQALCDFGQLGVGVLLDHFSTTTDRYSQEQIAEQIGKAGMLPLILETCIHSGRQSELAFVRGMVRMGKGEALLAALGDGAARNPSENLLKALSSDRVERALPAAKGLPAASNRS